MFSQVCVYSQEGWISLVSCPFWRISLVPDPFKGWVSKDGYSPLGVAMSIDTPRVGYSPPHWVLTPRCGMDMSMGVGTHPPINEILRDTVYKRAVRILLEWFLVVMKLRTLFSIVPVIPGLCEDGIWLSTVLLT